MKGKRFGLRLLMGIALAALVCTAALAQGGAELEPKEAATRRLQNMFPGEDFVAAEWLDWDLWEEGEKSLLLVVTDAGAGPKLFLCGSMAGGDGSQTSEIPGLIPSEAENVQVIANAMPDWEEDGGYYGTRLAFTWDRTAYTMDFAWDKLDGWIVTNLDVKEESQEEGERYWRATLGESSMEIRTGDMYRRYALYRKTDPAVRLLASFRPLQVLRDMKETHRRYLSGEAPDIPDSGDSYRFPQPQEAALAPGTHSVYAGPGEAYHREDKGTACVRAGGWLQAFGTEGDWVLIQYQAEGSLLRFGYVHYEAFEDASHLPELTWEAVPMMHDNQYVTSNPLGRGGGIPLTGDMRPMTRLCTMGEHWMYVELVLPNGDLARMFAETDTSNG